MNNVAVFIDGTTNDQTDEHVTNVLKMRRMLEPGQVGLYLRGLGNEFDNEGALGLVGRALGGAFGAGADDKKDDAYDVLSAAWQPGDNIFLIGFSRGAAIARDLAMYIHKEGLNGHDDVNIAFLGCFDTVSSFGIPGNNIDLFKDFHVSPAVLRARHAVSLHETRRMFPPTLMNQSPKVKEVWFKGDHSDVGGGHAWSGLSDITLGWMADEAELAGLRFKPGWRMGLDPDADQAPHTNTKKYRLHEDRVPGTLIDDEFHADGAVMFGPGALQ